MPEQLVDMKLRFVNKDQFKPHSFNTHRGNMVRLEAKQSEDINYIGEKDPNEILRYYGRFGKFLDVIYLNKPKDDKSIEEDEEQSLEPQNDEENEEQIEDELDNQEDEEQIEDEQEESEEEEIEDEQEESEEEESEYTREELEALNYAQIKKLAKKHSIDAKKKDEIIKALLGE